LGIKGEKMANLPNNDVMGFKGSGIVDAAKKGKGGEGVDPSVKSKANDHSLFCNESKSGGSLGMGAIDKLANDNRLIK
jgi:hypothetical protein